MENKQPTARELKLLRVLAKFSFVSVFVLAIGMVFIFAKPYEYKPLVTTAVTRTLNTAYQPSAARTVNLVYAIKIDATISLTTGQSATVLLQISRDNGATDPYVTISTVTSGNTGTLTIGLALTQTQTASLAGTIPPGYYYKMVTSGTATITGQGGVETQQ